MAALQSLPPPKNKGPQPEKEASWKIWKSWYLEWYEMKMINLLYTAQETGKELVNLKEMKQQQGDREIVSPWI